jgi:tetratricopeptide (TPR) repeat protein
MSRSPRLIALAAALALVPGVAHAADTGGGAVTPPSSVAPPLVLGGATTVPPAAAAGATPTAASLLAEGRASIAAKKWPDAIASLKKAAALDPKDADIQNLLGFSTRNNGDYPGALAFYDTALKLNPKHLGALEYQGEAFVKLGQMSKAKANMATLKKLCGTSCEEYKDLAAAIKSAPKKK